MDDALALLVLPAPLERFELAAHARGLLSIPRVVALEPSRVRTPRVMRDAVCIRQARRLRFPGRLALVALYDPAQYPLARALCARHEAAELWYAPSGPGGVASIDPGRDAEELAELDGHARYRAARTLDRSELGDDSPLRDRLRELGVITPYAYAPSGGATVRWARRPPRRSKAD